MRSTVYLLLWFFTKSTTASLDRKGNEECRCLSESEVSEEQKKQLLDLVFPDRYVL